MVCTVRCSPVVQVVGLPCRHACLGTLPHLPLIVPPTAGLGDCAAAGPDLQGRGHLPSRGLALVPAAGGAPRPGVPQRHRGAARLPAVLGRRRAAPRRDLLGVHARLPGGLAAGAWHGCMGTVGARMTNFAGSSVYLQVPTEGLTRQGATCTIDRGAQKGMPQLPKAHQLVCAHSQ